jgi:hypothetical protein
MDFMTMRNRHLLQKSENKRHAELADLSSDD